MTDIYFDFSGARPAVSTLPRGVVRYLVPPANVAPAAQWKACTLAELTSYRNAGKDVVLNFEWYEGRMLEGYAAGYQDGTWAKAAAIALGYKQGRVIFFSHDTSARNDSAVANYLRGVIAAMGGYYIAGIYSGIGTCAAMLNAGIVTFAWQTSAWSGAAVDSRVVLYQHGQALGGQVDVNYVMRRPIGSEQDTMLVSATASTATTFGAAAAALGMVVSTLLADNPGHVATDVIPGGGTVRVPAGVSAAPGGPITVPAPVTPAPAPKATPTPAPAPAKHAAPTPAITTKCTVVVHHGELLGGIASTYHTTPRAFQAANPTKIRNINVIFSGEVLEVPGCHSASKAAPAQYPAKHAARTYRYIVSAGQYLDGIAEAHSISRATLLAYNPSYRSHPNDVRTGAVLILPA